jgi:hypothetical protein
MVGTGIGSEPSMSTTGSQVLTEPLTIAALRAIPRSEVAATLGLSGPEAAILLGGLDAYSAGEFVSLSAVTRRVDLSYGGAHGIRRRLAARGLWPFGISHGTTAYHAHERGRKVGREAEGFFDKDAEPSPREVAQLARSKAEEREKKEAREELLRVLAARVGRGSIEAHVYRHPKWSVRKGVRS